MVAVHQDFHKNCISFPTQLVNQKYRFIEDSPYLVRILFMLQGKKVLLLQTWSIKTIL